MKYSHPLAASFGVSEDLNEVDFGGAEGLPQMASAAILAPSYLAWSHGNLDKRAGVLGESGVMLRRRGEAAAGTLLASCREGRQVCGRVCSGVNIGFAGIDRVFRLTKECVSIQQCMCVWGGSGGHYAVCIVHPRCQPADKRKRCCLYSNSKEKF